MERVFWVECPACHDKFYCNYDELRHASVALLCPFCRAEFLPDDATWVDDRPDPRDAGVTSRSG